MKILSAILIFLLLSSPVYGITVSEIPIEELPKKADFVIIGTVTDSEPNTTPPPATQY